MCPKALVEVDNDLGEAKYKKMRNYFNENTFTDKIKFWCKVETTRDAFEIHYFR